MKKTINGKIYDTERSNLIKKVTSGTFGDPAGFEETLYQTEAGNYFLFVNGGVCSQYTEPDIKRMSRAVAESWMNKHI
ncbi:MAG: hypothetical protein MJ082_01570 [Clostridia bacterium]|nr:hypothetical protein [Clostridia bacterium]